MSYSILTIPPFDKQLKRLSKKYPSLKKEFSDLLDSLAENPQQGTDLGHNCFKIRIAIASKGKGKRGGGRVITNFLLEENTVYLISIYDKSERDSVSDKELDELLKYL